MMLFKEGVLKKLYKGQSLLRILMDLEFRNHTLRGRVVDVGGARTPDYFHYFKKEGNITVDPIDGTFNKIDFEKDALPFTTESVNTVISANVLEHIYNYRFLVQEMHRILTKGGTLVGFVPFLMYYHPDPQDFFRYTQTSLRRIFEEAGFTNVTITIVGGGPFFVNFNMTVFSIPPICNALLFPMYYLLDKIFLWFRPASRDRYPLGYVFSGKKSM